MTDCILFTDHIPLQLYPSKCLYCFHAFANIYSFTLWPDYMWKGIKSFTTVDCSMQNNDTKYSRCKKNIVEWNGHVVRINMPAGASASVASVETKGTRKERLSLERRRYRPAPADKWESSDLSGPNAYFSRQATFVVHLLVDFIPG
eukprot:g35893.t1